ncbi:MAG: Ca2+-binding RTX toxin-like protein [Halocynthiibacter sp.]
MKLFIFLPFYQSGILGKLWQERETGLIRYLNFDAILSRGTAPKCGAKTKGVFVATYVFHGFDPSAWVIEGGGPSVVVGSKLMVDPEWSTSTDALEFSVTDGDTAFEGDDLNDGVGNDATQQVLVKDAGGATLYNSKGYLENSFTLTDGNGNFVTVYDVYIGTTFVGSVADGPITPGVTWEVTSIDNVTGANAPLYSSIEDQLYEQVDPNAMSGGAYNDSLLGGASADTIDTGGGASNYADGGAGNDTIWGGSGSDTLLGGADQDEIWGDGGNDSIDGGAGNDLLGGDAGDDTILGQAGVDTMYGGIGNDYLDGGSENDFIEGGTGDDTILGGSGNDIINGDEGNDSIDGGIGDDTIDGGDGADTIQGGDGADSILYGDGGDLVYGGAGNDVIDDVSGTSFLIADTIYGDDGNDTIWSGGGNDYVRGGNDNDWLYGEDGDDTLYGDAGNDAMSGGLGADYLEGGTGDDMLFGNEGDDTLFFGLGNDTVYGGDGNDSIDDASGELTDVYSSYLDGGAGSDTIHAGGGSDTLIGGADNDFLFGEQGDDSLSGGAGDDAIWGGLGNDTIHFSDGSGSDTIHDFDMGDDDLNGLTNDQFDVTTLLDAGGAPVNFDDVVVSDDGAGNAVLTFPNGEAVTLIGVAPTQVDGRDEMHSIGIPCYGDGTRILTPAGEVLIETLRAGDHICTMHHGVQPILWAGKRCLSEAALMADPRLRPLRIRDGTLGNRGDLLVSPQHAMLVPPSGPMRAQMPKLAGYGRQPHGQLIRATHLQSLGDGRVRQAQGKRGVTYHHLLLPMHAVIFANGAPGESLFPGVFAMAGFERGAKAELFSLFPALSKILTGADASKLYGQHVLPIVGPKVLRKHRTPVLPSRDAGLRYTARFG